ncbi:hypothetical protein [Streptomyces sp. NPDC002215]|uniref:hypothetical protein n=1 Tax=Streptomyces sp. NPDC002215 TaxID=3154412 RepID=UPI003328BBB6
MAVRRLAPITADFLMASLTAGLGLLTVSEGHALKVLAALQVDPAALRETVLAQTALEGS